MKCNTCWTRRVTCIRQDPTKACDLCCQLKKKCSLLPSNPENPRKQSAANEGPSRPSKTQNTDLPPSSPLLTPSKSSTPVLGTPPPREKSSRTRCSPHIPPSPPRQQSPSPQVSDRTCNMLTPKPVRSHYATSAAWANSMRHWSQKHNLCEPLVDERFAERLATGLCTQEQRQKTAHPPPQEASHHAPPSQKAPYQSQPQTTCRQTPPSPISRRQRHISTDDSPPCSLAPNQNHPSVPSKHAPNTAPAAKGSSTHANSPEGTNVHNSDSAPQDATEPPCSTNSPNATPPLPNNPCLAANPNFLRAYKESVVTKRIKELHQHIEFLLTRSNLPPPDRVCYFTGILCSDQVFRTRAIDVLPIQPLDPANGTPQDHACHGTSL
ncbi:hypothetical protein PtA15_17A391 [Puccinia triticina]|uniref:Zn(2)-C6 fungal-type domain-containing protein n=1 Tax=Puccinia triticina TaxID=208348 RepID=A0ABY7D5I8_9BASI|nr:uncharacterized protein PtA15_17A391 [Puccinia triticina]WAQ92909.1 hypothetical protein PtA15_17A391 [Puccinia triticina]